MARNPNKTRKKYHKSNEKKKGAYLELLRQGVLRGAAAEAIKVDRTTIWRWIKEDPEFAAAVEAAEMSAIEAVEDALYKAALEGNVVAMQVILYNRAPYRWADKRRVSHEHSGPGGGPIEFKYSEAAQRLRHKLLNAGSETPEGVPQTPTGGSGIDGL